MHRPSLFNQREFHKIYTHTHTLLVCNTDVVLGSQFDGFQGAHLAALGEVIMEPLLCLFSYVIKLVTYLS